MGLLSDSHYALFEGNIISVHVRIGSEGGTIFELRLNGLLADSHKDDAFTPKAALFGTITRADGSKSSVQVDIKMSWIKSASYTLLIDGNEVSLIKSTEAKIKEKIRDYGYEYKDYRDLSTTTEALLEEVKAQLMKDEDKKQGWGRVLAILAISLVLFAVPFTVVVGDIPFKFEALIIFIGVIFIHELGHLLGMKIFGYRDLKMFFIPFFGAAVHGKKENVSRHHEAIVTLMGPIPGLLLGLVLIEAYIDTEAPIMEMIAGMLVIINVLNLLPITPLDGGRFLEEILFCRNRFFKAGFMLVCTVLLIVVGLAGLVRGDYLGATYIVLGIIVGIRLLWEFKIARTVSKIKQDGIDTTVSARELGDSDLSRILERLKPLCKTPKDYANMVKYIIEQLKKPPGIGVTIILLFIYLLFLCLSVTGLFFRFS